MVRRLAWEEQGRHVRENWEAAIESFLAKLQVMFQFHRVTAPTYFVIVRKLEWFYIRVFQTIRPENVLLWLGI